jgi:hypothetical protein
MWGNNVGQKKKGLKNPGQSALEYMIFIVLLVIALIASQIYIKRAMQGKWREAADSIGQQYDPNATFTFGDITQTSESNTISNITSVTIGTKGYLLRNELVNSQENHTGSELISGY